MSPRSLRPSTFVSSDKLVAQHLLLCVTQSQRSRLRWRRPFTSGRSSSLQQDAPAHENTRHNATYENLPSSTLNNDYRSNSASSQTPRSESDGLSVSSFSEGLTTDSAEESAPDLRRPRALQAIFMRPLKRKAEFGVPACDLQLRSYGPRNVEFFADFALRAAYYLGLPASGPVPLPRITERWTVPRDNFIFKKSQENFERITYRRLIQIQDANTEMVEIWLAFLRKHAYYGVGMKANVWQYEKLGVGKTMDVNLENLRSSLDPAWAHFGRRKTLETSEKAYQMIKDENFEAAPNTDDVAAP